MTKGKTTLIQKNSQEGTIPSNSTPWTCLPMTRKILTAKIREEIYYLHICSGLFPEERRDPTEKKKQLTYTLAHPQGEQSEKCSHGVDQLQKTQ